MTNRLSYKISAEEPSDFDHINKLEVYVNLYIDGIHFLPVHSSWLVDVVELLAHQLADGPMYLLHRKDSTQSLEINTEVTRDTIKWLKPKHEFLSAIHASYCITRDALFEFDKHEYFNTLYQLYKDLEDFEKRTGTPLRLSGGGYPGFHWKVAISQRAAQTYCADLSYRISKMLPFSTVQIHFTDSDVYHIPMSKLVPIIQQKLSKDLSFMEQIAEEDSFISYLRTHSWAQLDQFSWPFPENAPLRSFSEDQWQNAKIELI